MPNTVQLRPELLQFLRHLAKNNNREWFQKNKDRYEHDVREPLLRFIEAFEPRPTGPSRARPALTILVTQDYSAAVVV